MSIIKTSFFMLILGLFVLAGCGGGEAEDVSESHYALTQQNYMGDGNNLDLSKAQYGDVILTKGVKALAILVKGVFPGYWEHASIYIGNGQMVEGWPTGVRTLALSSVSTASDAAIYRVNTTDSVKTSAVNFALAQVGKPYDYSWLIWPGHKSQTGSKWYCSELAWASYKNYGVELDGNPGYNLIYWNNVAPGELTMTGNVWQVAIGH